MGNKKRRNKAIVTNNIKSTPPIPKSSNKTVAPREPIRFWPLVKRVPLLIWGLILAIPGILAYLDYTPRVGIKVAGTLDENNAFATLFEIQNNGKFDVKNVKSWLVVDSLQYVRNDGQEGSFAFVGGITFNFTDIPVEKSIRPNDAYSVDFPMHELLQSIGIPAKKIHVSYADMTVCVTYKYLFWDKLDRFHVLGRLNSKNQVLWDCRYIDE